MEDNKVVESFHLMWDGFPGLARLVDARHTVVAANPVAESKGFAPGCTCAKVGEPAIHRECKLSKVFESGEAITDNELPDRIRGWAHLPCEIWA